MTYKHIHFIGIGGIGVSGLAKLMFTKGVSVSGSDLARSELTDEVAALGIAVGVGHRAENIPAGADLVVYSEAVPSDNPERDAAANRGVKQLSAAEFIGEITDDLPTIAVSGTNGKSTTTAMLGLMLERAGLDPTVIVGSKVPSYPLGNIRVGKNELIVLEADEYRAKYLNYRPQMIVLTNIEEDHLDYYSGLPEIAETFERYLTKLKPGGKIILNADDPVSADLEPPVQPITYGLDSDANLRAGRIKIDNGRQMFEIIRQGKTLGEFRLRIPARYNVANALAAATAALELGVEVELIRESLAEYAGIWRRFELVGEFGSAIIVSDYGHHPTSVAETVKAAREFYPGRRIILVFQPHQHSRTLRLFDGFVAALQAPDLAIVADIYHVVGRDEDCKITSRDLVASSGREGAIIHGGSLPEVEEMVRRTIKSGDVVIFMGAGDIDKVARRLCQGVGSRA